MTRYFHSTLKEETFARRKNQEVLGIYFAKLYFARDKFHEWQTRPYFAEIKIRYLAKKLRARESIIRESIL